MTTKTVDETEAILAELEKSIPHNEKRLKALEENVFQLRYSGTPRLSGVLVLTLSTTLTGLVGWLLLRS